MKLASISDRTTSVNRGWSEHELSHMLHMCGLTHLELREREAAVRESRSARWSSKSERPASAHMHARAPPENVILSVPSIYKL